MRSMILPTPEEQSQWPAPNYSDPVNLHAMILGFTVPSLILSVAFLGIRFYGKGLLRQILGLDDYIMLAAMVFALPVTIFPMASLKLGLGLHTWDLKPEWHAPYWKVRDAVCTPKCSPITSFWDSNAKPECIDMRVALEVIAALNSFSDCVVYLWPAKPLWSLQLPLRQRIGLICLFGIGLLVCITGILRMYYLKVFFESYDMLWHGTAVWIVMVLELDIGIICGCLSGVKPVMSVLFPALFGSSQHSQAGEGTRITAYGRPNTHQSFMFKALSEVSSKQSDHISIEEVEAQSQHGRDTPEQQEPNFNFATVETQSQNMGNVQLERMSKRMSEQQSPTLGRDEHRLEAQTGRADERLSNESGEWILERDRRKSAIEKNGMSDTASEEWVLPADRRRSFA
ncbi:hypothetical protein CFE70_002093 [Pyrenophora teres f. teres 0-1]